TGVDKARTRPDPRPSISGSFPWLILRRRYLYSPSRKLPPRSGDAHGGQDGDRADSFRRHWQRREGEGREAQRGAGPDRAEDKGTRGRASNEPRGPPRAREE